MKKTKQDEIEELKARVKQLENRPLERIIERMKSDIVLLGVSLYAVGSDYMRSKVDEVYERWEIEK